MKQRRFFSVRVRTLISEFGVVISIALMVSIDYFIGLETPKLHVPTEFEPTRGYADRGWFIPPFGRNPTWSIGLAAVFAIMGTILMFMDQHITARVKNIFYVNTVCPHLTLHEKIAIFFSLTKS